MCTKCGYETTDYEPFSNVTLPSLQTRRKTLSVYDCFDHFNRDEELDTDNQDVINVINVVMLIKKLYMENS